MLEKMKYFLQLLKEGREVSNPEFWKKGQAYVQPVVAALILTLIAIAKSMGYDLPVSDDLAYSIAGAIFFAVNSVLTVITTRRIGVRQKSGGEAEPPVPSAPEAEPTEQHAQMADEQDVSHSDQTEVEHSSIDADTRKRAEQWVREHSVKLDNGLRNDA